MNGVTKSIFQQTYDDFRTALTEARIKTGLSQRGLAARLEKPQSFVSKYERGERRLDVIEFFQITDALRIDPFEFLRGVRGERNQGEKAP